MSEPPSSRDSPAPGRGARGVGRVLAACFLLTVALWPALYVRLRYEPLAFVLKVALAVVILALPAALWARREGRSLPPWKPALLALGAVLLGQFLLYALLPDLKSGAPIGPIEGVREILWDASFKGAPESLYGGMALVAGGVGLLTHLLGRR